MCGNLRNGILTLDNDRRCCDSQSLAWREVSWDAGGDSTAGLPDPGGLHRKVGLHGGHGSHGCGGESALSGPMRARSQGSCSLVRAGGRKSLPAAPPKPLLARTSRYQNGFRVLFQPCCPHCSSSHGPCQYPDHHTVSRRGGVGGGGGGGGGIGADSVAKVSAACRCQPR